MSETLLILQNVSLTDLKVRHTRVTDTGRAASLIG